MTAQPYRRNRAWLALGVVVVVALGLASRKFPSLLPALLGSYPGDALWALMVLLIIAMIRPAMTPSRLACAALATAYLVEASQLYQQPWINAIRATTPGHLVLGTGFQWLDLCAYTIGVACGVLGDLVFARRQADPLWSPLYWTYFSSIMMAWISMKS
jgi:hypothetical protein